MGWLINSPNRMLIQKIIKKREKLIVDITIKGKCIPDYQRKLSKFTKEIERLYYNGLGRA